MEQLKKKVRIVPMTNEYLNDVAELERTCFSNPWSRNMLAEELENACSAFLVALDAENGSVVGYRIGGKTGTADKVGGGVIVSFVCFAPADDPQVMMLLTLDEPSKWTGTYVSGGNMVAPVASSVMGEILPYLGIEPSYTAEELVGADKTVPNVVGLSKDAAAERLSANGRQRRYRHRPDARRRRDRTEQRGDHPLPRRGEVD